MDFPYKHVHEVWVGNSSADPFDTILGCPWKWSQLVKKLVYNLLQGRLQPTYTCVPLLSLAVARLLSTPGQLTLPIASPYTNLQSPTFVSAIGAPSNPRSASTGGAEWESTHKKPGVTGSRSADHLDILQIHSSGKNPGWSRPFFGAHVETADPFWNLNGDCLDVTYGCSSLSDACIVSIIIGGSQPFEGHFHLLSTSRTSQYDSHLQKNTYDSTKKPSKEQPSRGFLKKDTNVGTRDQPLKVTLMLSSCKNSPVARHLPWLPGEMVRFHRHAVFFQRWHTWYENQGCLELEEWCKFSYCLP